MSKKVLLLVFSAVLAFPLVASAKPLSPRQMVLAARAAKATPAATTNSPCKKIYSLGNNVLYKRDASGHLANTDRSQACSLITGVGGAIFGSYVPLLNSKFQQINTFKAYQVGGYPFRYRAYTYGTPCSTLSRQNKAPWYASIGNGKCLVIPNTTRSGNAMH